MFSIEGKVIVVTGSATGIGRVVAEAMVQLGARVIAADINLTLTRFGGHLNTWATKPAEEVHYRATQVHQPLPARVPS
jgi:NAD(P)-dependent dehydrogenase (short-subunit alcohol dehydrogenase family)